jgi:hypothetical protein
MIKPSDIVKHLKKYIGLFTDEFTSYIPVTSATKSVSYIDVVATDHGLSPGQTFILTGGSARNILTDVSIDGDLVTFTTGVDHDLIMPSKPLDQRTVNIIGIGEYEILAVPDRYRFTVSLGYLPVLSGNEWLEMAIESGAYTVHSVVDEDNFNFGIVGYPELPTGIVDNLTLVKGFRVAGAADFERAVAAYSTQTDPYLFVVMGDADTSKDRHTLNDSVAGFTRQNDLQLKIRQSFVTVIFIPTKNDMTGVNAQDKAYDPLLTAQMQCLLGYAGEDNNIIQYLTVPASHGSSGKYNSAYYSHSYSWEFTQVVDYQDGFTHWTDVAFRDIFSSMGDMDLHINLDEE